MAISDNLQQITAQVLNRACACTFLEQSRLDSALRATAELQALSEDLPASRPHLFSATTVFVSPAHRQAMIDLIHDMETVLRHPAYLASQAQWQPPLAHLPQAADGVMMGYDFHIGDDGPKLIEINTNAGGAWLNIPLARAQKACCPEVEHLVQPATTLATLEETFRAMFRAEWQAARGNAPLRLMAIVDEQPASQYLYPDFLLAQHILAADGIRVVLADPADLHWQHDQLTYQGEVVDLIYNRLTDFYLDEPAHAHLRAAYQQAAVVLTPHPQAHARFADKRHLINLSNPATLQELGLRQAQQQRLLAGVPHSVAVTPECADTLWATRRDYFFKPAQGYGSKATYRGDKLTRKTWESILAGNYIAQTFAPPPARHIAVGDSTSDLKFDVRAYVYRGEVQLFAARLYQGQTTNFRTPGGGFAPVFVVTPPLPASAE